MKPGLFLLLLLLAPPGPPGHCRSASGRRLPGKRGDCPPPSKIPVTACGNFCSSDKDCPGSERCCSTGCGRESRLPVGAKKGFCPRPKPGVVTICLVECSSDSDCQGSEKCCSAGCHVHCMKPVPAKPGVCPKRRVLQTFAPCKSSCSDDTDCPRHEKCCFTGCGLGCLPPDRGDICDFPPMPGPCRGRFRHYAYNPAMGTCQPFTYSGCGGNPNNFRTVEECQQVCQQLGRSQE